MTAAERKQIEDQIRELSGKNYNFEKFSDSQLLGMRKRFLDKAAKQKVNQQIQKENSPEINTNEEQTCDKCGYKLNFLGQCPVCDLGDEDEGRNKESFMLRKQNTNIQESYNNPEWTMVKTKHVYDSDGFLTDYTWYTDGNTHIMMFGDNEVYEPDIDYADYVTEDEEDASDWFDSYDSEYLDEGLDDYVEITSLNYKNPLNNNRLPGIQNEKDLAKAFEETGKTKFKININKLSNVSIADIRDTFGGNYFKRHFGWTASLHNENGKNYLYVTKILDEAYITDYIDSEKILIDNSLVEDFNQVYEIEYTDRESGEQGLKDTIKGKNQADAISKYFSKPRNASNEITKIIRKNGKELNEVAPIIAAAAGAALSSFASQAGANLADKIFEDVSEKYAIGDYVKFSDDIGKIIDIIKTSDGKEKYEIMSDYRYPFLVDPEDIDEISSEDEYNSFYGKIEDLKEVFYYKDGKKITEDIEETFGEPPAPGKDTGVANTLSALIQDEWQAIDGYNKAIENFTNLDMENITEVLKDIVAEENIHVGQLQAALQTIATNAGEIATGEKEAAEQLGDA